MVLVRTKIFNGILISHSNNMKSVHHLLPYEYCKECTPFGRKQWIQTLLTLIVLLLWSHMMWAGVRYLTAQYCWYLLISFYCVIKLSHRGRIKYQEFPLLHIMHIYRHYSNSWARSVKNPKSSDKILLLYIWSIYTLTDLIYISSYLQNLIHIISFQK